MRKVVALLLVVVFVLAFSSVAFAKTLEPVEPDEPTRTGPVIGTQAPQKGLDRSPAFELCTGPTIGPRVYNHKHNDNLSITLFWSYW